jgi:hypothetical protein
MPKWQAIFGSGFDGGAAPENRMTRRWPRVCAFFCCLQQLGLPVWQGAPQSEVVRSSTEVVVVGNGMLQGLHGFNELGRQATTTFDLVSYR